MDSVCRCDRWYGHIPGAGWDEVTSPTEWACGHWDQPGEGIGETRGGPGKFLCSRLVGWVAIERAIRLATRRGLPAGLERWRAARDAIDRRDHGPRLVTSPEGVRPLRRRRRHRRGRSADAAGQVTLSGYPPDQRRVPPRPCPRRVHHQDLVMTAHRPGGETRFAAKGPHGREGTPGGTRRSGPPVNPARFTDQ